jgi:large subunit ribosomal protein L31e
MSQELERVYTINLGKVLLSPDNIRARRAINMIKEFGRHHMKVEDIRIEEELSQHIWKRGIRHPPRKVRVSMTKTDGDYILVSLYDEGKVDAKVEEKSKIDDKVEEATATTEGELETKVEESDVDDKVEEAKEASDVDKAKDTTTKTKEEAKVEETKGVDKGKIDDKVKEASDDKVKDTTTKTKDKVETKVEETKKASDSDKPDKKS